MVRLPDDIGCMPSVCPYGQVGDRLWVRETYVPYKPELKDRRMCIYKADLDKATADKITWKPSRFMFKWASRIWLEITEVRVERVQEISQNDVLAEGLLHPNRYGWLKDVTDIYFQMLWDSINGKKYPWSSNPWVWVIEFKGV